MIIEYYTHKPELSKIRSIQIGNHVVGLRVLEVTITSQDELDQLLSEEGIAWAKKSLRFPSKKVVRSKVTENESNWGSDWVDDGV